MSTILGGGLKPISPSFDVLLISTDKLIRARPLEPLYNKIEYPKLYNTYRNDFHDSKNVLQIKKT